jgi:Ca2+-binding EF-hand superfamily protein
MLEGLSSTDWITQILNTAASVDGTSFETSASSQTQGGGFADILLKKLDKDGDGTLSKEELTQAVSTIKNSLSQLNDIASQMRAVGAKSSSQAKAAELMSALDANGSSDIDISECGLSQDDFMKVDADGDGRLSMSELSGMIDKAGGKAAGLKMRAGQSDCQNVLAQLQSKASTRQYETNSSIAQAA